MLNIWNIKYNKIEKADREQPWIKTELSKIRPD